jgi:hypothetical protein
MSSLGQKFHLNGILNPSILTFTRYQKTFVIMFNGGIGSCGTLYNILCVEPWIDLKFTIFYFEGSYYPEVEKTRVECIQQVMLNSKDAKGDPLISKSIDVSNPDIQVDSIKLMVHSFISAKVQTHIDKGDDLSASQMKPYEWSRQDRLCWLYCRLSSILANPDDYILLWGNVQNEIPLLEALGKQFGFKSLVLFPTLEQSLLNVMGSESTMENVHSLFGDTSLVTLTSTLFPRRILALSSSCQRKCTISSLIERNNKSTALIQPFTFSKHCDACWNCVKYKDCVSKLINSIPLLIWGDRERSKTNPLVFQTAKNKSDKWLMANIALVDETREKTFKICPWENPNKKKKSISKDEITVKTKKRSTKSGNAKSSKKTSGVGYSKPFEQLVANRVLEKLAPEGAKPLNQPSDVDNLQDQDDTIEDTIYEDVPNFEEIEKVDHSDDDEALEEGQDDPDIDTIPKKKKKTSVEDEDAEEDEDLYSEDGEEEGQEEGTDIVEIDDPLAPDDEVFDDPGNESDGGNFSD